MSLSFEKNKVKELVLGTVAAVNAKNPYYTLLAFLMVLFLLDYFLVMQFQLRTFYKLNPDVATKAREFKATRDDIAKMPQYQSEALRLAAQVKVLNDKIRSREEVPLIIDSVTRIARKNGIRIEQMMPDAAVSEPLARDGDARYFSIPLLVEARGAYHNFGQFLNQLEKEEAFLSVGDFSIESNPADATHHTIKLTLNAIVFEAKGQ